MGADGRASATKIENMAKKLKKNHYFGDFFKS
jgi:hypothetical protein